MIEYWEGMMTFGSFQHRSSALTLLVLGLTMLTGCCSSTSTPARIPGAAAVVPDPLDISLHGTFSINVSSVEAAHLVPPAQGNVELEFHSRAIPDQPRRSNFHAVFRLLITNPEKAWTYVKADTQLDGQCDGSPVEGAKQAFTALARTLDLIDRATATSRPSHP